MSKAAKRRHRIFHHGNERVEVFLGPKLSLGIAVTSSEDIAYSGLTQAAIAGSIKSAISAEKQSAKASKPRKSLTIPKDEPGAGGIVTREWLIADRESFIAKHLRPTGYGWKKNVSGRIGCSDETIENILGENQE